MADLARIQSIEILDELELIIESCEFAKSTKDIPLFKVLKGYKRLGRIRIYDYRIGCELDNDVIIFCCILHRSTIYKQFP